MFLEIRVLFVLLMMNWLFVLTVETSLIDRDGKAFRSLKENILGTLIGKSEEQLPEKSVGILSAGSIPTVNRQLTNSKQTLENLTSVMKSQSLDPYRSIRISRVMYHKLS